MKLFSNCISKAKANNKRKNLLAISNENSILKSLQIISQCNNKKIKYIANSITANNSISKNSHRKTMSLMSSENFTPLTHRCLNKEYEKIKVNINYLSNNRKGKETERIQTSTNQNRNSKTRVFSSSMKTNTIIMKKNKNVNFNKKRLKTDRVSTEKTKSTLDYQFLNKLFCNILSKKKANIKEETKSPLKKGTIKGIHIKNFNSVLSGYNSNQNSNRQYKPKTNRNSIKNKYI